MRKVDYVSLGVCCDVVQEKAQAEGLVPAFNRAMDRHHTTYRMKLSAETGKYYPASCTGKLAKRLAKTAACEDEDGTGWLRDIGFKDKKWIKRAEGIWRTWWRVMGIGRAFEPTESEQAEFGPLCKKLFR